MQHSDHPIVHDMVACVDAPTLVMSGPDGQLSAGSNGVFLGDRRLLSRLELHIDRTAPVHLDAQLRRTSAVTFAGVVAPDMDSGATVTVERHRRPDSRIEDVTVRNASRGRLSLDVELAAGTDFAGIAEIRDGRLPLEASARPVPDGLAWRSEEHDLDIALTSDPPPDHTNAGKGCLRWALTLGPGEAWTSSLSLTVPAPTGSALVRGPRPGPWSRPEVRCRDPRVGTLVERNLADLDGLLLAEASAPQDAFLAAGVPWFLTLFGRDSLWAARMMLPLGTELAAGTLRTLARRQGTRVDHETEEEPGKILHELRQEEDSAHMLPPVYYGTVDATPLFVSLLADAWRWGLPPGEVESLLPAAEAALAWLRDHADHDGDGFIEYVQSGERGLANQGWKDSPDAVAFSDGRLAEAPIALAEVQGYAHEAAVKGAELLDAFARPGAEEWRAWARALRERFRRSFWAEDEAGAYPAIALDAAKQPVDAVASNMGHLLGTGLLDSGEEGAVARRLVTGLDSGWGLRTLSERTPGFNPLGYHTGSVWPHDTAIAVAGLARGGHTSSATALLTGLIDAAPRFSYRLPELYGGQARTAGWEPVPYPHTCRPQAWSAAASVLLLQTLLGLEANVPQGVLSMRPLIPPPYGPVEIRGLRVAGERLSVRVHEDGRVDVYEAPGELDVLVSEGARS